MGSITVETALVLPLFLFAMLSVMYLTDAVRISSENTAALSEKAYTLAKYAYLGEAGFDKVGLSSTIDMINGGDDIIDLTKRYRIDVPFDLLGVYDPYAIDRVRVRAFTGYDNVNHCNDKDKPPEEMVYVTETGSVYHRSLACSHLNLNIKSVDREKISYKRANDGSKYYPCEHCARGKGTPAVVYITDDGNRYHTSLSCPDLKRTIREVPLSEISLPPCSECGGGR
ncbi:MAG: pilus assembly protein [Lachnospiraceae bacterium]|nr:pilus assembly protein [Lachnospiraceae bacterium]